MKKEDQDKISKFFSEAISIEFKKTLTGQGGGDSHPSDLEVGHAHGIGSLTQNFKDAAVKGLAEYKKIIKG